MSGEEVMALSKRKNGTYRAAAAGWGNGKGRKKPREVRTHSGNQEKTLQAHDTMRTAENQEGDEK